jgi:Arc/MetJ-type ribon-helix-helix transcriptional regulator
MTRQIAIRLPERLVDFLDELVASGHESSRASAVGHAVERERRRREAERDIVILMNTPDDPDLLALAEYGARLPRPELD